jgi:hypothetical protein
MKQMASPLLALLVIGGLVVLYLSSQGTIKLPSLIPLPPAFSQPLPLSSLSIPTVANPSPFTTVQISSITTAPPAVMPTSSSSSIPSAMTIYDSETLSLPPSVRGVIIFLPDEAHEATPNMRIGPKNGEFLPINVVANAGTSVAILNGDAGHIHSVSVGGKGGGASTPYTGTALFPSLTPGSYEVVASGVMRHGKVMISQNPANGDITVGLIYVPTPLVSQFKSAFSQAGFSVLSEHNYSKRVGRINENTVLVYSTTQDIQAAIQKLPAIEKMNTYK